MCSKVLASWLSLDGVHSRGLRIHSHVRNEEIRQVLRDYVSYADLCNRLTIIIILCDDIHLFRVHYVYGCITPHLPIFPFLSHSVNSQSRTRKKTIFYAPIVEAPGHQRRMTLGCVLCCRGHVENELVATDAPTKTLPGTETNTIMVRKGHLHVISRNLSYITFRRTCA